MQVTRVIFLLLFFIQDALVLASTKKSFAQKLYGVGIAHQRLHQSQMLDHLAASTSTGTVSPAIPSAILAAAATTFQIYTSDALPTSPAPPSACANALTAGLNLQMCFSIQASWQHFVLAPVHPPLRAIALALSLLADHINSQAPTTYHTLVERVILQYSVANLQYQFSQHLEHVARFGAGIPLCLPQVRTVINCYTTVLIEFRIPVLYLYTVLANQTCQDVADAVNSQQLNGANVNVTFTQLLSFNPDLGNGCSNIGSRVARTFALGNAPTDVSKPTVTITATASVFLSIVTIYRSLDSSPPPGQTAPGTTSACGAWYLVQPNNFCIQVVLNNTITLDDFLTLNPEVGTIYFWVNVNCTNLWAGYYYCVAPFPPLTPTSALPSLTANATSFHFFSSALPTAVSSTEVFIPYPSVTSAPIPSNLAPGSLHLDATITTTLQQGQLHYIETLFGLTDAQFKAFNPGATTNCPTLTADQSFCESYYTVVSGDNCGVVESKNNITDAQFKQWNPEINTSCPIFSLGRLTVLQWLRHQLDNYHDDDDGYPSPAYECGHWDKYNGKLNVTVVVLWKRRSREITRYWTVEQHHGWQFKLWNPELNTACTNLLLDEAYCVAMATPTTTTTTTTSSSPTTSPSGSVPTNVAPEHGPNTCTTIEASGDIAIADFLRWNPEVTTNCGQLSFILISTSYSNTVF
ncbi:hypothetical protein BJ912DRAFT_1036734 [Pholiota molesta]|nr:hypothetical protein BJ912DRAFT_1036734 [Pholiota molesta]